MVKCDCGQFLNDEDIVIKNEKLSEKRFRYELQISCDDCQKTMFTEDYGIIIDKEHGSKILNEALEHRRMQKKGLSKEVLTTFEWYSYAQKERNSRLPKFSKREFKLKADEFGRVLVLYYTDGSIGLKRPE